MGGSLIAFFKGSILAVKSAQQLWTAALGQLEVEIPRPNFETWLKDTVATELNDNVLVITTPSAFAAEMLEQRLSASIERAVEHVARSPLEVRFSVRGNIAELAPEQVNRHVGIKDDHAETVRAVPAESRSSRLKPEFTFERFVTGPSNQLASAAAEQVAESPGAAFNPLYIYSSVGLGKTHLLQAIGHRLKARGMSVIYVSAERFTNEYIRAIRDGATEEFRARYRGADALLVDDIQFITSKPQTQEGFFHTFNELHMSGRQIVVTGDVAAEKIRLEERINSRLTGGLAVDIQPPDYETRYAILECKSAGKSANLPASVLDMLASSPVESVRDLEGSLNRVIAFAQLTNDPVDERMAERALAGIGSSRPKSPPSAEAVIAAVAAHTGVPESSITGDRRDRRTSGARRMAAYLLKEESKLPATHAGKALGGKDHSTVLYAQKKFELELAEGSDLRRLTAEVRRALRAAEGTSS